MAQSERSLHSDWRRHVRNNAFFAIFIVVGAVMFHYQDKDAIQVLGTMKTELAAIEAPAGAALLSEKDHHKAGSAYVERTYRSDQEFSRVRGIYASQLLAQGWQFHASGNDQSEEFCRNGHSFEISKCKENTYWVSIGWHVGDCGR
jgi:hypothetical protein